MSALGKDAPPSVAMTTNADATGTARLPISVVLTYVLPTLGVGFMFLLVNLYLMSFATDVLLIAPAAMGAIFGVSRIWDAVSDPIAGYFSDRTKSRFGRRRPWLIASIIPIGVAYVLVWSPPAALTGNALVAWTAVGVFAFYSAMTIFVVPHTALGAELTNDTHDRMRIFGVRHVGWTLGSLLAVAGLYYLTTASDARSAAFRLALFVAVVTGLTLLWSAARLRERSEYQGRGATNPFAASRDVWENPHARLLLIVFLIENLGAATIAILTPYVGKYVLHTPDQTSLFILVYMVASVVFVPIWLPLGRRFGKKRLWVASMLLTSVAFGGMFFLTRGSLGLVYSMAALAGFAAGCGAMMAPSIQADVIDYDEYRTGQRKEGAYFAAWNFVFKTATGVTLMLTGFVLQFAGFVPNAEQPPGAEFAIRALYSLFPLACYLIGTVILLRFGLDEAEHARIRGVLDERALAMRRQEA